MQMLHLIMINEKQKMKKRVQKIKIATIKKKNGRKKIITRNIKDIK